MESGAAGRVELLQGRACLEQQPHAAGVALRRGPMQRGVANPSRRLVQQRPPDNDNTTSARPSHQHRSMAKMLPGRRKRRGAPSLDHGLERDGLAAFGRCEPSLYQRAVHRRPRHRDQHRRLRHNDIILRLPDLSPRQTEGRSVAWCCCVPPRRPWRVSPGRASPSGTAEPSPRSAPGQPQPCNNKPPSV